MKPLRDNFGRLHNYLRISVTDRCNLRCTYCMPPEGIPTSPHSEILTYEEISRLVKIFAGLGVEKIRITGGEPLVRKNLTELILQISQIENIKTIGLTTNGSLLEQHLKEIHTAGLTHINISLDTLKKEKFFKITLRNNFESVMKGLKTAFETDFKKVKVNIVIMKGLNDDEILDFVELARENPIQVRLIEFMPFKSNKWDAQTFIPFEKIKSIIQKKYELLPLDTQENDTAKLFRISDFAGEIGAITSMSDHFCGTCNRLRLKADGSLKTCLFNPPETNLKNAIRQGASDHQIEEIIRFCLKLKKEKHSSMEELVNQSETMTAIGG